MFKVKVITIGKLKEKWLSAALSEYQKRLLGKMEIEWLILKDDADLETWALQNDFIALDPKGKLLTSETWSETMHKVGLRLNFIIGGALGLSSQVLEKAKFVWSLSPLTFTHQMTRLTLIEQLYRAVEIEKGSKYHK